MTKHKNTDSTKVFKGIEMVGRTVFAIGLMYGGYNMAKGAVTSVKFLENPLALGITLATSVIMFGLGAAVIKKPMYSLCNWVNTKPKNKTEKHTFKKERNLTNLKTQKNR